MTPLNPRKTIKEADATKGKLLLYYGPAATACCPKDLLMEAADTIGSLQFDLIEKSGDLSETKIALANALCRESVAKSRLKEAEALLSSAIALDSGKDARVNWLRKYEAYFDKTGRNISGSPAELIFNPVRTNPSDS